jgi:hypothetical protein
MQDIVFVIIAAVCGITAFVVIMKRYGSDCIP